MTYKWKRVSPGNYGFVLMEEKCTVEIHCMAYRRYGKWRWGVLAIFKYAELVANVSIGEYAATKAAAQRCAIEAIPMVRTMMNDLQGQPATGCPRRRRMASDRATRAALEAAMCHDCPRADTGYCDGVTPDSDCTRFTEALLRATQGALGDADAASRATPYYRTKAATDEAEEASHE